MHNITTDISIDDQHTENLSAEHEAHLKQSCRIFVALVGGLLGALWFNAPAELLFLSKLLGVFLGIMTLAPLYLWLQLKEKHIPLMELISLHYFLIFCPPIFLGPITFIGATQASIVKGDDLTMLLLIVSLGIVCFLTGYYAVRFPELKSLPLFNPDWDRTITILLIYLGISTISPVMIPVLPSALAKVGSLAFKVNGSVATYALAVCMYSERLSSQQRKIYLAELGFFIIMCLASGWLHIFVYPMMGFFLGMVQVKNRIPWVKIGIVCFLIVILQMSKSDYREKYWGRQIGSRFTTITDPFSRTKNWLEMAFSNLSSIGEGTKELAQVRVNHLSFFGHVVRVTPKYIPFLNGSSYMAVPATFIPRLLWPGKPGNMKITNELAIRYGWQSERLIGRVSLSPGLLDEAYINFGVVGVVAVMLLFGAFIRWLKDNLGNPANGFGWQLVLIGYMLGGGLMVTWLATSYFGGLWQTLIIITILYWPLRLRS